MAMSLKPCSTMVGTSGKNGERCAVVMAKERSLPERMCGNTSPITLKLTGIWPPSTSCNSGAPPRYGTLVNGTPEARASIMPAKCSAEPAAGTP